MQTYKTEVEFNKDVTFKGEVDGITFPKQKAYLVRNSDGSFFGYYTNPTAVVNGIADDVANPVITIGGSGLTSLEFSDCAMSSGGFILPDTSGLTSLETLFFSYCGYGGFSIPDTSGLTSLTTLSFSNCGYSGFTLPDTSGLTSLKTLEIAGCMDGGHFILSNTTGLTSLETLSFSSCGGNWRFSLTDTSSLTSLTSLSFNNCGPNMFLLPDTTQEVGPLSSLTSFTIDFCGPTSTTSLDLIATALVTAGKSNGTFTVTNTTISGDKTALNANLTTLRLRGWTAPNL